MEVITIENTAFARLIADMEKLIESLSASQQKNEQLSKANLATKPKNQLEDQWLDNEAVCKLLRISKRTLQNYRDKFILPYSQIGKKILYRNSDISKLLEKNYLSLDS